jgi:thioredoxin 1
MSLLVQLSEAEFEAQVEQFESVFIVEFGAPWCVPCKQMEPVLVELVNQWDGRVKLAKVNVDECVSLTMRYRVMSVPTVILFKGGKEVVRLTGYQSRQRLAEKLSPEI